MATDISVNKKSVRELLESGKDKTFVIPEYQKSYAWTLEESEKLFDDLWNFSLNLGDIEYPHTTYFLGSMVAYMNSRGEQEILDGHQRLISLLLLLRAIYMKISSSQSISKEEKSILRKIAPTIWHTERETGEVHYSEILLRSEVVNDADHNILKEILETGKVRKNAKDCYSTNYQKFITLFDKISSNGMMRIYNFVHVILNKTFFLVVDADNQDMAFTIFSTLNKQGAVLSDVDLFKAKIYNHICDSDKRNRFIVEWQQLEKEAISASVKVEDLFRYYMMYLRAIEEDTTIVDLNLRNYFAMDQYSKLYDVSLLENLNHILNLWIVINKREILEGEAWSENVGVLKILDCLKSYPGEYWKYSVVTYYLKYYKKENFEALFLAFLRRLFAFLFDRYLDVSSVNVVREDLISLNQNIVKTTLPAFKAVRLDDNKFLENIKVPDESALPMVLKIMAYSDYEQIELLPEKWEVEYIFPNNWHNRYFLDVTGEDILEKIEHIGNKIPFERRLQVDTNKGYFGKKKGYYKKSRIAIVAKMGDLEVENWALHNIDERDESVAKRIKGVLTEWIDAYDPMVTSLDATPTEEELKQIERFKAKGWI